MDKYYFIEVQTYQSVNNMGLELGRYVEEEYNHKVVHANQMYDIKADITAKMDELQEKFPRSRAFDFRSDIYDDKIDGEHEIISVAANRDIDKYVLILRTTVIRNKSIEPSIQL